MFAYIPANLDLSSEKHRDKYYFIITFIFFGRIFDKRKTSSSFIQLYSPFLKAIINGRYKDYLQDLMRMRIIETDNHYILKKKSKAYRLTEIYSNQKIKRKKIMDEKIISNYWKYKAEQKKRISAESQHNHLFSCLEQIEIDYEAAINILNTQAENVEQYNAWHISIERIYNKDWFFIVDKTAGRVHNNITNLPKIFRPFLSFRSNPLIEIDISNSQPLLFNVLISRYLFRRSSIYNPGINLPYVPPNSDLILYKEVTEQGKFYEFMMNELDINESRDNFKVRMFTNVFYGKNFDSEEIREFKKIFPSVYEILDYYKKINYKDLSIELQRVEAEIMINSIVKRLAMENIFALTIHDSILTIAENSNMIKNIILDEFDKYFLRPTLKVKNL